MDAAVKSASSIAPYIFKPIDNNKAKIDPASTCRKAEKMESTDLIKDEFSDEIETDLTEVAGGPAVDALQLSSPIKAGDEDETATIDEEEAMDMEEEADPMDGVIADQLQDDEDENHQDEEEEVVEQLDDEMLGDEEVDDPSQSNNLEDELITTDDQVDDVTEVMTNEVHELLSDEHPTEDNNGEEDIEDPLDEVNGTAAGNGEEDILQIEEDGREEAVENNDNNGLTGNGGGVKRKGGPDATNGDEDVGTVRKSSRLRDKRHSRMEADSLLQGKSVHDPKKGKAKMLQKPEDRATRHKQETEASETEGEKDEQEDTPIQSASAQGDPTRPPGSDSNRKIDHDFLIPFKFGWTREVVFRPVKTGPPQVDIFYWPPKDNRDVGSKTRDYRRKRRSKVDQERYFEDFPHEALSVNNFSYVRRPLGLNNEAYEIVRREIRSGLETRSDKRTRGAKVTNYKEVAEHEGLLSGPSSEEEKEPDEVEDVTEFNQGLPISLQVLRRVTPLRDEYKKRHKVVDRDRCPTPPNAEDILWTFLDDDPMGIYTELGGSSRPPTPPPLRAVRLTSHEVHDSVKAKHQEIRDGLQDPLKKLLSDPSSAANDQLRDNLASHDLAIKKWQNLRTQGYSFSGRPTFGGGARNFGGSPPGRPTFGRRGQPGSGYRNAGPGIRPQGNHNIKIRLPMLSTNGKRPVVELVMLTLGKYQPIKFTNNRQVTESVPKRLFDQANLLKKTIYQRSVQVPKIGTKQVFVAVNPSPDGRPFVGGQGPNSTGLHPPSPQRAAGMSQNNAVFKPHQQNRTPPQQHQPNLQNSEQVSILVKPAQGGNTVLLNVPRNVALKVKKGTTLSFSASNEQKYVVIDNKMHPPVGKGRPIHPGLMQQRQQQQQHKSNHAAMGRPPGLPNLPSGVSIRPIGRVQPQPNVGGHQVSRQPPQLNRSLQPQARKPQQARNSVTEMNNFTPCSPFCPGVSGIPELECSSCHSLFHPKCVGIPPNRVNHIANSFRCKGCTEPLRMVAGPISGARNVQVIDLD